MEPRSYASYKLTCYTSKKLRSVAVTSFEVSDQALNLSILIAVHGTGWIRWTGHQVKVSGDDLRPWTLVGNSQHLLVVR